MEISAIHEAALRAHVVPGALDQVTALVRNHFGTAPPKPAELDTFLAGLAVWTKLGVEEATFLRLPPTERSTLQRTHCPTPPVSRRPVMRSLTPEELASIEGLPWAERREKARAMQQTPLPPQP